MAQRTEKSVVETLRDIDLAEKSGIIHTKADGSVEIKWCKTGTNSDENVGVNLF